MASLKKNNRILALMSLAVLPLLSSCASEFDMQGHDPQHYYTQNPVVNKLENKHSLLLVEFAQGERGLTKEGVMVLADSLKAINPRAVDAITIRIPARFSHRSPRINSVNKVIRAAGFKITPAVVSDKNITEDDLLIDINYVAVLPPDCPDWRKSPVTTFSNTVASNYGCATVTNLGLMVANPRDLARGQDSKESETERAIKVLLDHRSGAAVATAPAP